MKVEIVPILEDNYCYILTSSDGVSAIVDPGDALPVIAYCKANAICPSYILNTHHHWDHTDGNLDVAAYFDAVIVGPEEERGRVPGMVRGLSDGDVFMLGDSGRIEIIETAGHTLGHICFYAPDAKFVMTGDTLFSLGIGRLFEGTPEQQFNSLEKLKALPDDVYVYCGHEYTEDNIAFAASLEGEDCAPIETALAQRALEVRSLRGRGLPSLPVTIGVEKATNPFMRVSSDEALQALINRKTRFAVGLIRSRL